MLTDAEIKIISKLRHGDRLRIAEKTKLSRFHVYKVMKGERHNDSVWEAAIAIVKSRDKLKKEKEKVALSLN